MIGERKIPMAMTDLRFFIAGRSAMSARAILFGERGNLCSDAGKRYLDANPCSGQLAP
jgi:hypothetical protein